MVKPFVFEVGQRTVNLNASGVNQLLNAASAKEAYSTRGGGLLAKFCDFFCIGNDRNAIKALFYAIVTALKDASPQAQLLRFQKLASCANTNYAGLFHIQAKAAPSTALRWKYSFLIDNTADNGDLLFDAVFSKGDEERVLRLCNRSPTNGEFRVTIVQNAFVNQSYTDLYDFITAAYGTENDSELRYNMRTHFISLNNMIQTHIKDADVVEILSAQVVARMGYPPVAVAKLINM